MKEDGSLIRVQDISCLVVGRRMGGTAETCSVRASEHAFQHYPGGCYDAAGMNFFGVSRSTLHGLFTIFFQVRSFHTSLLNMNW